MSVNPPDSPVTRYCDCDQAALESLLARFGLRIASVADGQPVPGSFWGDEEAGLQGDTLWLRGDTPLHSALHEACHYICMDEARRAGLDTDAGGGYDEENARRCARMADQAPAHFAGWRTDLLHSGRLIVSARPPLSILWYDQYGREGYKKADEQGVSLPCSRLRRKAAALDGTP
jgi:hypothetical protein